MFDSSLVSASESQFYIFSSLLLVVRCDHTGANCENNFEFQSEIQTYIRRMSGNFYFKSRQGKLNIKELSRINVDSVIKSADIGILQSYLENLTFSMVDETDLRGCTDGDVVKLFRITQLVMEYLLHTQDQLLTGLSTLANKYNSKKNEINEKKKLLVTLQESCKHLKNENKIKMNSIATLESLVANTHNNKLINEEERIAPLDRPKDCVIPSDLNKTNILLYISSQDGLCVELECAYSLKISAFVVKVEQAFQKNGFIQDSDIATKLIYKGKVLLEDSSLLSNKVQHGDTMLVLFTPVSSQPKVVDTVKHNGNSTSSEPLLAQIDGKFNELIVKMESSRPSKQDISDIIIKQNELVNDVKSLESMVIEQRSLLRQPMPQQQVNNNDILSLISDNYDQLEGKIVREINDLNRKIEQKINFGRLEDDDEQEESKKFIRMKDELLQEIRVVLRELSTKMILNQASTQADSQPFSRRNDDANEDGIDDFVNEIKQSKASNTIIPVDSIDSDDTEKNAAAPVLTIEEFKEVDDVVPFEDKSKVTEEVTEVKDVAEGSGSVVTTVPAIDNDTRASFNISDGSTIDSNMLPTFSVTGSYDFNKTGTYTQLCENESDISEPGSDDLLDKTIDSEGNMVKTRDFTVSVVLNKVDDYENQATMFTPATKEISDTITSAASRRSDISPFNNLWQSEENDDSLELSNSFNSNQSK